MTVLDLDFVRSHFPAFSEPSLDGQTMLENAGGSYACSETIDLLDGYYRRTKVQPYLPHAPGIAAGAAMDRSYALWAEALGVAPEEVNFGPSTSANAYVIAQAFRGALAPDAEIVVTNADHEANMGAMRRMAQENGFTLREWKVDPQSGQLDDAGLDALLTDKTAVVCLPHCSNIVGQENPVGDWTRRIKTLPQKPAVIIDGVSRAPHGLPDVGAIGCDIYLFSLYKVYSVHQGLMVARRSITDFLPNQGHFFNEAYPGKRLTPAGPDHAQIAAASGVLDYVAALDRHHGGTGGLKSAVDRVNGLWKAHEDALLDPLLAYLRGKNSLRIIGQDRTGDRHPTIALDTDKDPEAVATALGERGIMCGFGDFYAYRLVEALGIDPARGVVRLSLVHYNTPADVEAACEALDAVL